MSDWLKQIKRESDKRPNVIAIHGVEGIGKTAFAAQFKGSVFMMSDGETGILKLMENGLVPACGYFPAFESWKEVLEATDEVIKSPDRPQTLVVDTINGIETLLHSHICATQYEGNYSKKGFFSYDEGPKTAVPEWRKWLAKLDAIRSLGSTIVLLSHTKATKFRNPEGPDFDRYVAHLHPETWGATCKFADLVLFINYAVAVTDVAAGNRGKGQMGSSRIYHCERGAAWDAKNRHNLPKAFLGVGSAAADFKVFTELMKAGAKKKAVEAPAA